MSENLKSALFELATGDLKALKEYRRRTYRAEQTDDPRLGWKDEAVYEFTDGRTLTLECSDVDDVLIPATHGYELLVFQRPEEGDPATHEIASEIGCSSVVAWNFSHHYGVTPITTDYTGTDSSNQYRAIRIPDGRVEWHWHSWGGDKYRRYSRLLESVEAWVEAIREDWARLKERERAKRPCEHCGRPPADAYDDDDIPF